MSTTSTTTDAVTEVAAKAAKAAPATFDQLIRKPRRTMAFNVYVTDEDGADQALAIKFKALSSKEYDDLVAAHPPTQKEKQQGAVYNVDTFAPALISAVSYEPALTLEQATELYRSPDWSGGEVGDLFMRAARVCNSGLDVPFNARD
jgi:hypothetical protein